MVISIFKIVAIADLIHFSSKNVLFRGFHQIFSLNDGKILVFQSKFVLLNLINHVERVLNKFAEQIFSLIINKFYILVHVRPYNAT